MKINNWRNDMYDIKKCEIPVNVEWNVDELAWLDKVRKETAA